MQNRPKAIEVLLLSIFLVLAMRRACADDCEDRATAAQNKAAVNPAGADGKHHVTYTFVDGSGNALTPDANIAASAASAFKEWNAFSSTTNVQFDEAPPAAPVSSADIQIQKTKDSSGNTGGCAAYKASASRIYYGETFQTAAINNSTGTTIFAHEIGHALGLADAGPNPVNPTIMNNPSNAPPLACTAPQVPTHDVLKSDATNAAGCNGSAKLWLTIHNNTENVKNTDQLTLTTVNPACTFNYGLVYFYVDGVYDSSELFLDSVVCL